MKNRLITKVLASIVLLGGSATAQSASISLSPLTQTVELGNQIILMLYADFRNDPALGGGLDIFFDSNALEFTSFDFMAPESVGDDPDFRRDPDVLDGELNGLAFGNFDGMAGRSLVGLLQFDTLATGLFAIEMAANEGGPPDNPGPFVSFVNGLEMEVTFKGSLVEVVDPANPVPLPAAVWLLMGGLGVLGATRRKNSA